MNQILQQKNAALNFTMILIMILFTISVFGQEKSIKKFQSSKAIKDAFAYQAVTVDEMTKRAQHHPYVQDEIVVAIEFAAGRARALSQIQEFDWSQVFENEEVKPIAYLMTKEHHPNRSVSLVHLSLEGSLAVVEAMQLLDGKPGILWSSPNFYFDGDPREIVPNDPSYGSQYHHPLMQNHLAWDITFGNQILLLVLPMMEWKQHILI
ncbi:MAG: hypothetical protein R2764_05315 [Bacteroidales bacterium]